MKSKEREGAWHQGTSAGGEQTDARASPNLSGSNVLLSRQTSKFEAILCILNWHIGKPSVGLQELKTREHEVAYRL